jgi:putative Mg2+ transporter-C (MgtC) family protein
MLSYGLILERVILSSILGLIIGIQRETRNKPAGVRTITLITLGSTLFTLVSIDMFPADANKMIAQVITGIGFLGAGTIFRHKDHIEGLTTSACIWASSGMGIAVGLGQYFLAVLGFLFIFIILSFYLFEKIIHKGKKST